MSDDARLIALIDPIEFILSEHFNHRRMCGALERLAEATEFVPASVASLEEFIRCDLALHIIDEEKEFFPVLRQHCLPEDEIDALLARLAVEHAQDKTLSTRVCAVLDACMAARSPPSAIEGGPEALRAFALHERRHLTLENAVIVPLARRRLAPEDLGRLGERLMARRIRLRASGDAATRR